MTDARRAAERFDQGKKRKLRRTAHLLASLLVCTLTIFINILIYLLNTG